MQMVFVDLCQQQVCPGQGKPQEVLSLLPRGHTELAHYVNSQDSTIYPTRGCFSCAGLPLASHGAVYLSFSPFLPGEVVLVVGAVIYSPVVDAASRCASLAQRQCKQPLLYDSAVWTLLNPCHVPSLYPGIASFIIPWKDIPQHWHNYAPPLRLTSVGCSPLHWHHVPHPAPGIPPLILLWRDGSWHHRHAYWSYNWNQMCCPKAVERRLSI